MSRIFTIVSLCLLCVSTASAAPLTPRNNKALVIKQTMFEDGRNVQSAAITTPTVLGSKDPNKRSEMMRDEFGAVPIAPEVLSAKLPIIGRVNYQDLFNKLQALADYQYNQYQDWDDNINYNYNNYYRYRDRQNGFGEYGGVYDNCYSMENACMQPPGNYTENANSYYLAMDPSYAFAVDVRRNVPDAAPGAESVVIYAQNAFMKTTQAKSFKQNVINFLRESNIEYAWIDVETELTLNGRKMRVASSLQINRSDTPDTPGQFIGATIVPPPGETIVAGRRNSIDVTYHSRSQYPDLYNTNLTDPIFSDRGSWGILMWNAIPNGDPVSGSGSGAVQTNGAYDDIFHSENVSTGSAPIYVRSINNTEQLTSERGVKCLTEPLTAGCITGFPNIPSLMRENNASKGTLTYIGRWELQHEAMPGRGERSFPPMTNSVRETHREVQYNLCHDVVLNNELEVQYRIRRLIKKYDVMNMDGKIMLVPQAGSPQWEIQNYVLPNVAKYSSHGEIRVSRDPAGGEYGMDEYTLAHSVILNPLTWSAARGGIAPYAAVHDSSTGDSASDEETWAPRMTQKLPPTFTRSPSLPGYVGNEQGRYHYFTCEQANASEIASIRSHADPGSVSVTGDTDGCRITWRETTWVPAPGSGPTAMSTGVSANSVRTGDSDPTKKPHWTTEGGVDPGATCDVCDLPMEPVEPLPFDPGVDPVPVEPTPVDPAPVEPSPVDPVPVDPIPVDPAPTGPTDPAPTWPSDPAPTGPTEPAPTWPSDPAPTGPSDPAPSGPEPEPEPTAPTPPPMVPVVKNFDQPLGNPACEETCPEDGSTPWNLCPRY